MGKMKGLAVTIQDSGLFMDGPFADLVARQRVDEE